MLTCYKQKYYLNASHSFDYDRSKEHYHTFAITVYLEVLNEEKVTEFVNMEEFLLRYFESFKGKYLNECREFLELNPTIENIGDYFYEDLKVLLLDKNMSSERLADNRERWMKILEKRSRTVSMLSRGKEKVQV